MNESFSYREAFSRNIGWVTSTEQEALHHKKVAIAGMGGVGGVHLVTLARLGIGAFHIADFDAFDLVNFNRQVGATVSTLMPGAMTFAQFFLWGDLSDDEKALRFLLGLAPAGLHRHYLVDPTTVSLTQQRGPSTIIGCQLCAGIVAAEALKILLGRGKVVAAPHGVHFDAYRNRLVRTWRPGGNNHPLQRLALKIARRHLASQGAADG